MASELFSISMALQSADIDAAQGTAASCRLEVIGPSAHGKSAVRLTRLHRLLVQVQVQVQVCFTSVDGQVQPLDVVLQP
jgi:hypothetical protein